jgi:hypothetical protein
MLEHTLVRALRTVCLVAGHIEDSAFDGDIGRVVRVGACFASINYAVLRAIRAKCNSPSHFER